MGDRRDPLAQAQFDEHVRGCDRGCSPRVSITSYDGWHQPQVAGRMVTDERELCPEGQRLWDALNGTGQGDER